MQWNHTALLIVDPQVDLLAPEGALWDLVGDQVSRLGIVDNLVALRDSAEAAGVPVLYSWLRLTEEDYATLEPKNGLQKLMADRKMARPQAGGRFVSQLEPTPKTILLEPRQGPSSVASDLQDQLRQRGIETIVVAGMVANLCVESHVRDVTDAGFGAVVVEDAIATTTDEALA
ncbi:MAG: isochorismatase family cysteine hydrolase, partial [Acidobacteriota bacterium]